MKLILCNSHNEILNNKKKWKKILSKYPQGVILRGLYKKNFILKFKRWIIKNKFFIKKNYRYNLSTPNHSKIVNKDYLSKRPTRFMLYQYFLWNETENQEYQDFFINFIKVKNILNGLSPYFGIKNIKKFISWISVLHYRRGGDYIATHKDNYMFQSILIMSEFGKDFKSGGQYFLNEHGNNFTEDKFKIGDLVMLKANYYHGVYPIDQNLKDDGKSGRWMMFSPYVKSSLIRD